MKTYSFKLNKTIKAPRKTVYATWTDPKAAKKFTAPEGCKTTVFQTNFKVGGQYRIAMETPYGEMKNTGEYLEIIPNKKIVQTFIWDTPDTETNVITIEFKDKGKDTLMSLQGAGYQIKEEAAGNKEGWDSSVTLFAESFQSAEPKTKAKAKKTTAKKKTVKKKTSAKKAKK